MLCIYFSVPFQVLTIASLFVHNELVDEIQKLWSAYSHIWLTKIHKNKGEKPSQLNVYKMFLAWMSTRCSYNAGNTSKHSTSRAWLLTVGDGRYKMKESSEARKSGNNFFYWWPSKFQSNQQTVIKNKNEIEILDQWSRC